MNHGATSHEISHCSVTPSYKPKSTQSLLISLFSEVKKKKKKEIGQKSCSFLLVIEQNFKHFERKKALSPLPPLSVSYLHFDKVWAS